MTRGLVSWLVARDVRRRTDRIRAALPALDTRSPYCTTVRVEDVARGHVSVEPQRQKVLIVGGGVSRYWAPLDDPTYEVWCCNDLASICVDSLGRFRADRWFELHVRDAAVEWRRRADFWEWLSTMPVPLYQFSRRDSAQSLEYPLETVIRAGRDYFGCTFAYQIGLAIAEGFDTIALYGVDLGTAREATVERATVEWWAGYAEGQGLTIEWPPCTREMIRCGHHPYRYGHPDHCEDERALVYDWIRDRYQPTLSPFLLGNRPPQTLRDWWRWRQSA